MKWLTNILLVNPSDVPHVKSHQRRMLTLFTPSCRASGKILTSQMQNSFSPRSPSRARPRRKRARLLLIALLQLQQTISVLPAHAIWNCKSAYPRPKTKSWLLNSKFCDFAELMAAQMRIPRIPARNLPRRRHARNEQWTGRTNSPLGTFSLEITIH